MEKKQLIKIAKLPLGKIFLQRVHWVGFVLPTDFWKSMAILKLFICLTTVIGKLLQMGFFFPSQCLCTMKLRNAAVQECTSKHAVSQSICILITPQFGIKNQKKPHILVNLFLRLVLNKSVKSLALHHIPEGRTELLCDKCS